MTPGKAVWFGGRAEVSDLVRSTIVQVPTERPEEPCCCLSDVHPRHVVRTLTRSTSLHRES
jgi:hypothetical protein